MVSGSDEGTPFPHLPQILVEYVSKLQSVRTALTYNVSSSMDEIIDADSSCTYYEAKVVLELQIVTLSWDPDWL